MDPKGLGNQKVMSFVKKTVCYVENLHNNHEVIALYEYVIILNNKCGRREHIISNCFMEFGL